MEGAEIGVWCVSMANPQLPYQSVSRYKNASLKQPNRNMNANDKTYKNIRKWFCESRNTLKNLISLVFFDTLIIDMYYFEENDFNNQKYKVK